jgi:hypothetical protein
MKHEPICPICSGLSDYPMLCQECYEKLLYAGDAEVELVKEYCQN